MTNASTQALRHFWAGSEFGRFTAIGALAAVVLLIVVLCEREALRARDEQTAQRVVEVCRAVVVPLLIYFVCVVVARFLELS